MAAVLLPLLRDNPESKGLWQEALEAVTRLGVDSPFGAAVRLAIRDGRYRPIRTQMEALVAAPPPRPAADSAAPRLPLRMWRWRADRAVFAVPPIQAGRPRELMQEFWR